MVQSGANITPQTSRGLRSLSPLAPELTVSYSQLKQSLLSVDALPPGSLGSLVKKPCASLSGKSYLYRAYQNSLGKKQFDYICPTSDTESVRNAVDQMSFFGECATALKAMRAVGFPTLDKSAIELLVALFNRGLVGPAEQTLVAVGTTAYCAIVSDLGLASSAVMTRDLDLAMTESVSFAHEYGFAQVVREAMPHFFEVPGMPSRTPSTSLKAPGAGAMTIDLLTQGDEWGAVVPVASLQWHAQSIPYLDYLTEQTRIALALGASKAVPLRTPEPIRFAFHKAYSSLNRRAVDSDKKKKDCLQSILLLERLQNEDEDALRQEFECAPQAIQEAIQRVFPASWNQSQDSAPKG